MEFQLSYFKSWKMMLWKCCTQYASKFGKLSSGHRTGKGQFSLQSQRKTMPKNVQTTAQLHSFQMLAKQCSKFSKWGFNSMWTENFWMFKLDLEKAEETEIKLPTSVGSYKNQMSIAALFIMAKIWKKPLKKQKSTEYTWRSNWPYSIVLLPMQETWERGVWYLDWEDSLEEGMATHFNALAWRIPWTEKRDEPQFMGSKSDTTERLNMHVMIHESSSK